MNDTDNRIKDRQKDVIDVVNFATTKISELVRIIGFSLAGLYFVFSTSASNFAQRVMSDYSHFVVAVSLLGCLTIVLDYVQYVLALKVGLLGAGRADNPLQASLFPEGPKKKLQRGAFYAKQVTAILGMLAFMFLMYQTIPTVSASSHQSPSLSSPQVRK
jgi:hypothetical protein